MLPTAQYTVTGELETTFTTAICRSSNLQALLDRNDVTSDTQPLIDAFTRVTNEDHRGTRLADEIHHPPTKPPRNINLSDGFHRLLVSFLNRRFQTMRYTTQWGSPWFVPGVVLELDKVSIRGVIYASSKSLPRDSHVIFRKPGDPTLRAGKIDAIFSTPHPGANCEETKITCLVIQEWLPVMEAALQKPYQEFGFAGGFLCHNNFVGAVSILDVNGVVCHFAKTFFGKRDSDIFHVLPLNKVGLEIMLYRCRFLNLSLPLRCSIPTRSHWQGISTRSINDAHRLSCSIIHIRNSNNRTHFYQSG